MCEFQVNKLLEIAKVNASHSTFNAIEGDNQMNDQQDKDIVGDVDGHGNR